MWVIPPRCPMIQCLPLFIHLGLHRTLCMTSSVFLFRPVVCVLRRLHTPLFARLRRVFRLGLHPPLCMTSSKSRAWRWPPSSASPTLYDVIIRFSDFCRHANFSPENGVLYLHAISCFPRLPDTDFKIHVSLRSRPK